MVENRGLFCHFLFATGNILHSLFLGCASVLDEYREISVLKEPVEFSDRKQNRL